MERLKNKNILITGGRVELVWLLLRNSNVKVLVSQFAAQTRRSLKEARGALGPKALAFSAERQQTIDLDSLYSKIKAEFGHLDAVFANAGYSQFGPFEVVEEIPLTS